VSIATAIKTLQTEQSNGVSALIDDRAYLAELPETPGYPCTVHVGVSDNQDRVHPGESDNRGGNGLYTSRWQIDSYADSYSECEQLAKELDRLFTPLKRHPVSDTIITSCRRLSGRPVRETGVDKWRMIAEYEFMYEYLTD